ncbi:hypothetical protein HS088_TW16G00953 [Tripterygium wilfordii]|uniref:Uncharacterized protein n=1 Tax=Tripterygium wilfordii TaxID=458696 RepID=A0A7J7CKB7_TRIWF|nr:hypothetical protein HS088_TW16G00953 [Tripterygium wilfordii]
MLNNCFRRTPGGKDDDRSSCMMNLPFDVSLRGLAWFPATHFLPGSTNLIDSHVLFRRFFLLSQIWLLLSSFVPIVVARVVQLLLVALPTDLPLALQIVAFCICHTTKCHRLCFPTEHHRYSEQGLSAGILREATYTAARLNIVKYVFNMLIFTAETRLFEGDYLCRRKWGGFALFSISVT